MSQVNNQGELFGTTGNGAYASKGSRAEFERHFFQVPEHIKSELQNGKLRLGDQIIYSIKSVGSSTTIKMFETQDDKKIGMRNISNAKLQKNQALLCSGIFLLAGVPTPTGAGGTLTQEDIMATNFQPITADSVFAPLMNGEFNLKANKVQLVPETSMRIFENSMSLIYPMGYYKLDNPRLIADDVLIEATVELGTVQGIPAGTQLFLGLQGTITTP
jgi:hypothetical protein